MNVRELREALAALGPEYDESMVIVSNPGFSPPGEATRLITIPKLHNVDHRFSFELFERVVWVDSSTGREVSKVAEESGWRVPYFNPEWRTPSPLTRTPLQAHHEAEAKKRHVACQKCLTRWIEQRCVPRKLRRIREEAQPELCCHCGEVSPPVAFTVEGKGGCVDRHKQDLDDFEQWLKLQKEGVPCVIPERFIIPAQNDELVLPDYVQRALARKLLEEGT